MNLVVHNNYCSFIECTMFEYSLMGRQRRGLMALDCVHKFVHCVCVCSVIPNMKLFSIFTIAQMTMGLPIWGRWDKKELNHHLNLHFIDIEQLFDSSPANAQHMNTLWFRKNNSLLKWSFLYFEYMVIYRRCCATLYFQMFLLQTPPVHILYSVDSTSHEVIEGSNRTHVHI